MEDKAELEELARDMAGVKVELFKNPNDDLAQLDSLISTYRHSVQGWYRYFHSFRGQDSGYGHLALTFAVFLASRFVTARRKESTDLQEAKELEAIISRHNRNINDESHEDHYRWQIYKWYIIRADLMVTFQKLESRLTRLHIRQAQPLVLVPQTESSALPCTKPALVSTEQIAQVPALSNATNPLAAIIDTGHDLFPSPAQLKSAQPPFTPPPIILDSESIAVQLAKSALLNANDETEIRHYAICCQALAQFHFSRYRTVTKNAVDLEEAAEYAVTAFQLFADIADVPLWSIIPRTGIIILGYVDAYRGTRFPPFPNLSALETLGVVFDCIRPPPYRRRLELGSIFFLIYSKTKNPSHAEMSITEYEKAFASQPPIFGPRELVEQRRQAHVNLACMLLERYTLSGDSSDSEIAMNNLHLAEALKSDPLSVSALGLTHCLRFFRQPGSGGSFEDKEQAFSYFQSTEPDLSGRGVPCFPAAMLIASYCSYGDKTDLTRAIQLLEGLLIHDSFDHRSTLSMLVEAYRLRSAEGDQELAFQCLRKISEVDRRNPWSTRDIDEHFNEILPRTREEWKRHAYHPSQNSSGQFVSAHIWGTLALEQEDPECLQAFGLMASLIQEVAGVGNTAEDVYKRLQDTQNFGGHAAAAAVKFATASLAVEWLELGLSVNTRQIYQLRLDVGDLASQHPDLFENLKWLSEELRQLSGEPAPTSGLGAFVGTNKQKLRLAYEAHLNQIRGKQGMENFLRPLRFPQLAQAARDGPVILLSCDHITERTHAFIVLDPVITEPITVLLPKASPQVITNLRTKFSQLLNSLGIRHRSSENDTKKQSERTGRVSKKGTGIRGGEFEVWLSEIWMRIVKPIFDELKENNIRSGRVWWCPTGPFTEFPLHAAAPVDCPYISSYTYGLEILLKARTSLGSASPERSEPSRSQFSVVGIGKYPGRPHLALPSVTREIQILSDLMEDNAGIALHKMENDEVNVEAVFSVLKSSRFVHLACHGTQDQKEPLHSHLLLADGNLELRRILMEDLKSAEFAFLSACQTATGESKLANESVHLAGGFLAAGFKGVIGTLWRIADEDAPRVVKEVYETMKIEGGLDVSLAAEGLDRAVREMRKSGVSAQRWAPFIHVGV
ncbi:hypothetical protein NP233_g872 [Leucocoprinus birnbaumii]|uniref:CHAT domain-containing protein n=1 Tax=Leucocoprinus birnbaumii TaxID=56174 RepID=A0AAD5W1F3_9AGAR|nr:hypothetical protein NP233_g872 [Leucocoprinus birnbaumii]